MRARRTFTYLPLKPAMRAVNADNYVHAARLLGIDVRTIWRYKHRGIPLYMADRIADNIGTHPITIWGTEYTEACDERTERRNQQQRRSRQRRRLTRQP